MQQKNNKNIFQQINILTQVEYSWCYLYTVYDMLCMSVKVNVCQIGNTLTLKKQTNKHAHFLTSEQQSCQENPNDLPNETDRRPQIDPGLDLYLNHFILTMPRLTIKFCYRFFLLIVN